MDDCLRSGIESMAGVIIADLAPSPVNRYAVRAAPEQPLCCASVPRANTHRLTVCAATASDMMV
jgi:hypothetical protein